MEPRGLCVRLDYCSECASVVDAHAAQMREMQAELAAEFGRRKAEIDAEALRACPGLKLPL